MLTRSLIILSLMFLMTQARASIDHDGVDGNPTATELERSRGCFNELKTQGCPDPGENLREFRQCLHEAFPQLSLDCRKMMKTLYTRRE